MIFQMTIKFIELKKFNQVKILLILALLSAYFVTIIEPVTAKEIQSNITWIIDDASKSAVEIHDSYDITGRLVHVNKWIKILKNISVSQYCLVLIQDKNNKYQAFDYSASINDITIAKDSPLNFNRAGDSNTALASFPCVDLHSNDTLYLDYFIGGKVQGVHEGTNFTTVEEFYYPFDVYNFTAWSGLDSQFMTTHSAKITIPTSYDFVNNESSFSCPILSSKSIGVLQTNISDNSTIKRELLTAAFFTYVFSGYQQPGQDLFLESYGDKEGSVKYFDEIPCSPATEILKAFVNVSTNLTEPFDSIRDWRTGNYLHVQLQRP